MLLIDKLLLAIFGMLLIVTIPSPSSVQYASVSTGSSSCGSSCCGG